MLPEGSLIGRNPYEVWPQIHLIASRHGIELGDAPTDDEIQDKLFPLGQGKVYGQNAEELDFDEASIYDDQEYLDAVDKMLARVELRSIHGVEMPEGELDELGIGGTANWMERRTSESALQRMNGLEVRHLILLGGLREMDDRAGSLNPHIREFVEDYGVLPLEYQLLSAIHYWSRGRWHDDLIYESSDLDDNVEAYATKYLDELINGLRVYVALNAAAVDKAFQVRAGIRRVVPSFDADPNRPQFYFSADGFKVARTPEQAANPANFQRPKTFLSAIPRYVKQLHELKQ